MLAPDGRPFTWGKVTEVHKIGPYTVFEFIDKKDYRLTFHVFVGDKDTSQGSYSLEGALLIGIAYKQLGGFNSDSTHAAYYAAKILDVPKD